MLRIICFMPRKEVYRHFKKNYAYLCFKNIMHIISISVFLGPIPTTTKNKDPKCFSFPSRF